MTAQEIFNVVWDHLITKESPKSVGAHRRFDTQTCKYRGPGGTKCAIGVLVTDTECEGWDENSLTADVVPLPERLQGHAYFLVDLQLCHDRAKTVAERRERLLVVAANYNLTIPGDNT